MASRREQILAYVKTLLAPTTGVTGVYRSRQDSADRTEAPLLVITPGDDPATEFSICKIDHDLTLQVEVFAVGAVPDQAADPIVCDVHRRLMADRRLGGLCNGLTYLGWTPAMEQGDATSGWFLMRYRVRYRTSVADFESVT
jgi:hypothetical protein